MEAITTQTTTPEEKAIAAEIVRQQLEESFLELAKQYEASKKALKEINERLEQTMTKLGVGTYLQDPSTGAVYKVEVPAGTFISYKAIGYVRTALQGERQGSLSKKEAEEKGFTVAPKAAK